ncbi:PqqD family peptide modification chaperone [Acuticoccus sediminis]|uniref:PqqD family peptide modification chaperone n=1 Tax=Acuticoccus sediminis TaxID=2184697 RepID=UPI001CFEAD57|nr:PqqD family peptide modification chaperone [Acuticoccus sediminis]
MTLHPIGGSALLLDPAREAVFALDAQSAFLWCCLDDGLGEDDIVRVFADDFGVSRDEARQTVDGILASLDRLVEAGAPEPAAHSPRPDPARAVAAPDREPSPVAPVRVGLLGTVFDVTFPSSKLRESFLSAMGHLECQADGAGVEARVVEDADGYRVLVDGEVAEQCGEIAEVASQVKAALTHAAINRTDFDACVHAAVVSVGGRGVLLPAGSGSGKSCLALTLAGAGWSCLSDDLALFRLDGPTVQGVPAATCVKAAAWEAMTAIHPALETLPVHRRIDGKVIKYLSVARVDSAPEPVRAIIFPTFEAGAGAELTRLLPEEALGEFLASILAWRARLTASVVDGLIGFIEATPCYRLRYGASEDAVAVFRGLFPTATDEAGR